MITLDEEPDEIVENVVGCWEDWTTNRQKKEQLWAECVMNYLTEVDPAKYDAWPWRSQVCDTLSQETGDTVASSLMNGLFPLNEKFVEIEGEDEPSMATAPKMLKYLEAQLKRGNFLEMVRPWAKQISVIGNAPYLGLFDTVARPRKVRERTRNLRTRATEYRVANRAGVKTIKFYPLDAFDVAFRSNCLLPSESPMIWRQVMSKAQLLSYTNLDNLDELEEVEGGAPYQKSDRLKDQRQRAYGETKPQTEHSASDPNEIEVLHFFGDLELEDERYENQRIMVANRKVLLRAEEEPFWSGRPIGWGGYDQLWMSGFEKGPLEPLRGIQSLIDTFQNQKADILNLIINGAFAYVNDGIIDPENLWMRPGGFIEVGSLDNLKPLQPSGNVALTYQEIALLQDKAERSSGKSRFDMGQAPGGRRTAYEANMIRGGGSSRSNDILKHLGNGPMEEYLSWALGTLQQMKWGSGEIPNDVLAGQYRLNFLGADLTALRSYQIQNLMTAIQLGSQAPPEMGAQVNWKNVWGALFKALTMDSGDMLNTPEEAAKVLAQISQRERPAPAGAPGQSGSGPGGQDQKLLSLMQGTQQEAA